MLTLPCTPAAFLDQVVRPALLAPYLPTSMDTPEARAMLVAIPKQESDLRFTRQVRGPARSLYQFERAGILGVIQHPKVDDYAAAACHDAQIPCRSGDIMAAIESDHVLACRLARLNLWTDRLSLPKAVMASEEQAFQCYRRVWRPGAAKDPGSDRYNDARHRWATSWRLAVEACA